MLETLFKKFLNPTNTPQAHDYSTSNADKFVAAIEKSDVLYVDQRVDGGGVIVKAKALDEWRVMPVFFKEGGVGGAADAFGNFSYELKGPMSDETIARGVTSFEAEVLLLIRHKKEIASLPKERWILITSSLSLSGKDRHRENRVIDYSPHDYLRHHLELRAVSSMYGDWLVENAIRVDAPGKVA